MLYRLCDFVIESDLSLPELPMIDSPGRGTFRLFRGVEIDPAPTDFTWFHEWRYPDGELWTSFARTTAGYVCRFAGIADFYLSKLGTYIVYSPMAGVPDSTLGHIFLNQVMPIVLSSTGDCLVLHASAVAINDRAVAFLGMTGQGKSTMAGAFCQAGFPLLTDDFLVVEEGESGIRVMPTYGGLRLWDDVVPAVAGADAVAAPTVAHYTEKKRIRLGDYQLPFCADALPMDRFYLLEDVMENSEAGAAITPITRREAMIELTRFSFHLDLQEGTTRRAEFAHAARLAAVAPVFRLAYPRDLNRLDEVRGAVLQHLLEPASMN